MRLGYRSKLKVSTSVNSRSAVSQLQQHLDEKVKSVVDADDAIGLSERLRAEKVNVTSFRSSKKAKSSGKAWSKAETGRFYKYLTLCGIDYATMIHFFKDRNVSALQRKFKYEEKHFPEKINAALKGQLSYAIIYPSKLAFFFVAFCRIFKF